MENTTEKVTDRQRALLQNLMLSSTFTAEEAHRTAIWLNSPAATEEKATEMINWALARIKKRDQDKKASDDRKAAYHANNGEYPPRRYSNENPPVPASVPPAEQEQKVYRINGVDYTDKTKAAEAASKAIFG